MRVLEENIIVANRRGVHSRVAASLAMIAREHGVLLQIIQGQQRIDCSSLLDVLSLALVCGTTLTVRVQGRSTETDQALAAVERLLTAQDEG